VLVEWLRQKLQIQAVIKWPNDILSVKHKLAGLLIENMYQGNLRTGSIIGIGLNVNQEEFPGINKAISLTQITGKHYELDSILIDFLTYLKNALENPKGAISRYEQHLFKYRQETGFSKGESTFTAVVHGVDHSGRLILEQDGSMVTYDLKEIEWVY
jgi:BirA family biotin operon repressor/biotin-[acetyl-CoA-carboxylase] ligase